MTEKKKNCIKRNLQAYGFLTPFLVLVSLLYILPAILTVVMAFTDLDSAFIWEFAGLKNFRKIFRDPNTFIIIRNTVLYVAIAIGITICLQLFLATMTTYFIRDEKKGNSTFVAQNYGVKDYGRIQKGTKEAFAISIVFSIIISILVCTFAASLMEIFVKAQETAVIASGVQYLRIEGSFYCGIGCLFLLYGYYRAINKAQMSVVLTVISLGLRVVLAYILSVPLKAPGIWVAIVNHKNLKEI